MHFFLSPAVYPPVLARFTRTGLFLIFWAHVLTNARLPKCLSKQVPGLLLILAKCQAVAKVEDCPLECQPAASLLAVDVVGVQHGDPTPGTNLEDVGLQHANRDKAGSAVISFGWNFDHGVGEAHGKIYRFKSLVQRDFYDCRAWYTVHTDFLSAPLPMVDGPGSGAR